MFTLINNFKNNLKYKNSGMELVQVAILIAIAVTVGLIFSSRITEFVNSTFTDLNDAAF